MSRHLFLFTIGPVQSFIAQARKTHDLFAGSAMLSELCYAGMQEYEKLVQEKNLIVSPVVDVRNIPNRFLAIIPETFMGNVTDIGSKVKNAVEKHFVEIIAGNVHSSVRVVKSFDNQVKNFLEIEWVIIPWEKDYATTYLNIEKAMGAAKSIRQFRQLNNGAGEQGRKCNIDGERNIVVYRMSGNDEEVMRKRNGHLLSKLHLDAAKKEVVVVEPADETKSGVPIWELDEGEGLSAVTFVKRKYGTGKKLHQLPSTTALSLYHLEYKNLDEYKQLETWVDGKGKHWNDELLYKKNIDEKFFEKYLFRKQSAGVLKQHVDEFKALHDTFLKTHQVGKKPFTTYYALMQFDGDHMGEWLSGDRFSSRDELEKFHRGLTASIHAFAREAEELLKEPRGKVVYAGGEDFMAFINLHSLPEAVGDLHALYNRKLNEEFLVGQDWNAHLKKSEDRFSISAGIVIAHYKEPLTAVVGFANEMEKKCKNAGRNGFALSAMKHSGSVERCIYHWDDDAWQKMHRIVQEIKENFSSTFIKELLNELQRFAFDPPAEIIPLEIKRLVQRSCKLAANDPNRQQRIAEVTNLVTTFYQVEPDQKLYSSEPDLLTKEKKRWHWRHENFAGMLEMCDFLSRKTYEGNE